MLRIGWFSSGRDEAARNLLRVVHEEITQKNLDAEISWIFCNRDLGDAPWTPESSERQKFFWLALDLGIPVKVLSHRRFLPDIRKIGLTEDKQWLEYWRNQYGESIVELFKKQPVDVVLMAGYMLVVGTPELKYFRLLNLHPALPGGPAGTWQEVIHKVIEKKLESQGAMIHLATETLDRGPVVVYFEFPLKGTEWAGLWDSWDRSDGSKESHPLFLKIREEGEKRELPLIKTVVRLLSTRQIEICDDHIFSQGQELKQGIKLTEAQLGG
jgi:phosphoribosylglycinamide formyltransferase 1